MQDRSGQGFRALQEATDAFGHVDVLVNNVGAVRLRLEGFLELPVDTEPFQGGGLAAQVGLGEVDGAAIGRNAVPAVRSPSTSFTP